MKVAEIKKLNQEISKYENDLHKQEEHIAKCQEYKDFLDKLSPDEWKESRQKKREERKAKRVAERKLQLKAQGLPEGAVDEMEDDDSSSDEEMYFKTTDELMDTFTQLERKCLFYIEKSQESEEGLEELKQEKTQTEISMQEKAQDLQSKMQDLEAKIKEEELKKRALLKRTEYAP